VLTISSSDFIRKPSYITKPKEITFVEDAKRHITKSVVIPYELYKRLQEKIEDELYLFENATALDSDAQAEFLEIEESFAEDNAK